jgi:hypothetical protein
VGTNWEAASLQRLLSSMHPSAWKGSSANFAITEFYEVRLEVNLRKFARLAFASTLPDGPREALRGRV